MTAAKAKTQGKIQATRQWLNRAEDHFDRDQATRGQLDLLLAEAEIRSTRENLIERPQCKSHIWFRQGLAVSLAAILAAVGLGGFLWGAHRSQQASTVKMIQLESTPVSSRQEKLPQVAPVSQSVTVAATNHQLPPATVESRKSSQEVKPIEQPTDRTSASPTVSDEEMKKLIQAAGQSLRGRAKP